MPGQAVSFVRHLYTVTEAHLTFIGHLHVKTELKSTKLNPTAVILQSFDVRHAGIEYPANCIVFAIVHYHRLNILTTWMFLCIVDKMERGCMVEVGRLCQ
jgi:hypothetical protein